MCSDNPNMIQLVLGFFIGLGCGVFNIFSATGFFIVFCIFISMILIAYMIEYYVDRKEKKRKEEK